MSRSIHTAERVSQSDASDNFVFARSVLAYREAAKRVCGNVLEIGTGAGYGIEIVAPGVVSFTTIDKNEPTGLNLEKHPNVVFHQMKVPPSREGPTR